MRYFNLSDKYDETNFERTKKAQEMRIDDYYCVDFLL